jgi:hypothetical protein
METVQFLNGVFYKTLVWDERYDFYFGATRPHAIVNVMPTSLTGLLRRA